MTVNLNLIEAGPMSVIAAISLLESDRLEGERVCKRHLTGAFCGCGRGLTAMRYDTPFHFVTFYRCWECGEECFGGAQSNLSATKKDERSPFNKGK